MGVRRLNEKYAVAVAEICQALLTKAKAGRHVSLFFIAEEEGSGTPIYGVVGRFRKDPYRILGELVVVKDRLTEMARSMEDEPKH